MGVSGFAGGCGGAVEPELADDFAERLGIAGKRCAGGLGPFDHRGILLCHLIHLVDRAVDLSQADRLLPCGGCDGVELRIDGDDVAFNDLQGIARGGYEFDAVLNLVGGVADKLLDFLGRLRRTLCQLTHFLRDNRKTFARLTRAGCLDPCIERQKVGLERNLVDDADDVGNLA